MFHIAARTTPRGSNHQDVSAFNAPHQVRVPVLDEPAVAKVGETFVVQGQALCGEGFVKHSLFSSSVKAASCSTLSQCTCIYAHISSQGRPFQLASDGRLEAVILHADLEASKRRRERNFAAGWAKLLWACSGGWCVHLPRDVFEPCAV